MLDNLAGIARLASSAFMARLRDKESLSAKALEFMILTAARTGEVIGMRWEEIDGSIWTVPAECMQDAATTVAAFGLGSKRRKSPLWDGAESI